MHLDGRRGEMAARPTFARSGSLQDRHTGAQGMGMGRFPTSAGIVQQAQGQQSRDQSLQQQQEQEQQQQHEVRVQMQQQWQQQWQQQRHQSQQQQQQQLLHSKHLSLVRFGSLQTPLSASFEERTQQKQMQGQHTWVQQQQQQMHQMQQLNHQQQQMQNSTLQHEQQQPQQQSTELEQQHTLSLQQHHQQHLQQQQEQQLHTLSLPQQQQQQQQQQHQQQQPAQLFRQLSAGPSIARPHDPNAMMQDEDESDGHPSEEGDRFDMNNDSGGMFDRRFGGAGFLLQRSKTDSGVQAPYFVSPHSTSSSSSSHSSRSIIPFGSTASPSPLPLSPVPSMLPLQLSRLAGDAGAPGEGGICRSLSADVGALAASAMSRQHQHQQQQQEQNGERGMMVLPGAYAHAQPQQQLHQQVASREVVTAPPRMPCRLRLLLLLLRSLKTSLPPLLEILSQHMYNCGSKREAGLNPQPLSSTTAGTDSRKSQHTQSEAAGGSAPGTRSDGDVSMDGGSYSNSSIGRNTDTRDAPNSANSSSKDGGKDLADAAWAALGGALDRRSNGPDQPQRGSGLARSGGLARSDGGGLSRLKSVVQTNEDWRSAVNEVVWEPPPDTGDNDAPIVDEENGMEEDGAEGGIPEEVKIMRGRLEDFVSVSCMSLEGISEPRVGGEEADEFYCWEIGEEVQLDQMQLRLLSLNTPKCLHEL